MVRKAKLALLHALKRAGAFTVVANSRWRRQRLLILCYHGVSLEDEHQWRPKLYLRPELLEQRLESLRALRCSVLPLGAALAGLRSGDLPPRSVAITFDDGTYDFYRHAYPLLRKHGLPATVYQSTYYTGHPLPVFNLICSYMLWKSRNQRLPALPEFGIANIVDIRGEAVRHRVVRALIDLSDREKLTGREKNEIARRLAGVLEIDYEALAAKRILQLMNEQEVAEIARGGVDVQLHTHRHRTPDDEALFRREISDNRDRVQSLTGQPANHFCYPSGVYRKEFFAWLEKEKILSATTCDAGLVERDANPFLLPRFVDASGRTKVEFESWLSGVGSMLALRRAATQRYVVPED